MLTQTRQRRFPFRRFCRVLAHLEQELKMWELYYSGVAEQTDSPAIAHWTYERRIGVHALRDLLAESGATLRAMR